MARKDRADGRMDAEGESTNEINHFRLIGRRTDVVAEAQRPLSFCLLTLLF
jgi:hypothetical protein